jgi:hypothetical protein
VVRLYLLLDQLPHVFEGYQGGQGVLRNEKPRRAFFRPGSFMMLPLLLFEFTAFSDFYWSRIKHPTAESECSVHARLVDELLNVEDLTMVTYLEISSFSTLATGPTLPKNRVK